MSTRLLGWRKDPVDSRDAPYRFHLANISATAPAPESASLREHVIEVLDQRTTSSCVAHAIAQAVRIYHSQQVAGLTPPLMARLFIYFASRCYHNEQYDDAGTYIRFAFKALVKLGFCPETVFPFDPSDVNRAPPWEAYREAADQRAPTNYYRLDSTGEQLIEEVKLAISVGDPVVFGMDVAQAFLDWDGGKLYDPSMEDRIVGGHAMCAAEYDTAGIYGPNSWGPSYGRDGWFGMTWETVMDRWADVYVIRVAPAFA